MRIVTMQSSQPFGERRDQFMRSMESVPTQVYWSLAMGSVLFSALLYLLGRRSTALFVGQWAPTFLTLALVHKLLRPSEESSRADRPEMD
jgi:hypothetical protein